MAVPFVKYLLLMIRHKFYNNNPIPVKRSRQIRQEKMEPGREKPLNFGWIAFVNATKIAPAFPHHHLNFLLACKPTKKAVWTHTNFPSFYLAEISGWGNRDRFLSGSVLLFYPILPPMPTFCPATKCDGKRDLPYKRTEKKSPCIIIFKWLKAQVLATKAKKLDLCTMNIPFCLRLNIVEFRLSQPCSLLLSSPFP